jgi:hypothetical protein
VAGVNWNEDATIALDWSGFLVLEGIHSINLDFLAGIE